MATQKHASHAEIWDDSMLVNSWNDALEEYKVMRWYLLIAAVNYLLTLASNTIAYKPEERRLKMF